LFELNSGEKMAKAKKTSKKSAAPKISTKISSTASAKKQSGFFGLDLRTWISTAKPARAAQARGAGAANVYIFSSRDPKKVRAALKPMLLPWQLEAVIKSETETMSFAGKTGAVFVLRPPATQDSAILSSHGGRLNKSDYARTRDQAGSILGQALSWKCEKLVLHFLNTSLEQETAALVGLELASYNFAENRDNPRKPKKKLPALLLGTSQLSAANIRAASDLALATNIARHLINLPGGSLNPTNYAQAIEDLLSEAKNTTVTVWRGADLERENCGLLQAVGAGAAEPPALVHIRYRPQNANGKKPIALVGKGITFDTGGLDIKPSSAMRLMKKDMGGSAAVAGVAFWAIRAGISQPLDCYLALAENAVSGNSFRPGDIITARSGHTVEIDNTDAEGRLVLADALDVAVKQTGADAPELVINLATLTGAIKVALGAEISGLFTNNDALSSALEDSGWSSGELTWRMPLFQPYFSHLKSSFADFANSGPGGFAGAISAALFLQQFVGKVPWAHLDIYSWRDSAGGAYSESGGSGQGVQMLAQFLSTATAEAV
jgi:leucyl aminopeptidase